MDIHKSRCPVLVEVALALDRSIIFHRQLAATATIV
jgi:hypothetical protein